MHGFPMNFNTLAINATYFISVILSYMILVSMVGYVRALIAKWMGDDTAEHQGYLTLNPAVHVDIVGFILLVVLGIGWGRQIPVNPSNIQGRCRWLKISIAMLSGVIAYLLFAVLGLVFVAYSMGPTHAFGALTSNILANAPVISILHRFIAMCIFLAAMELVINIVLLGMLFIVEHNEDAWQYASYAALIIPIIIFLLYGPQIQFMLANAIKSLAKLISKFLFRT
jgi:hypothetical protein